MIDAKKLSFYSFGNFLIARVAIPLGHLHPAIACPQGYTLYYSLDGKILHAYEQQEKIEENKFREIYIYCIKDGNYEISIPFGVAKTVDNGYNFEIIVKCKSAKAAIEKILGGYYYMSKSWSYAERDGLIYEYISEFTVTKEHGFCGLSIAFRDEFAELFTSDTSNRNEAISCVIQKLNNKYGVFEFSCSGVEK